MESINTNPTLLAKTNREVSQQQTWQPFGAGHASVYVNPNKRLLSPSPNQTTLPLQKTRALEQFDIAAFDKKPADNTSLDISAEAAAAHKQYPSASTDASVNKAPAPFQFSREGLTDTQRRALEKLDTQAYCLARCTSIIGEKNQLRPVTLLENGVPISLYTCNVYTDDGERIAITLDPKQFPPQASYKKNAISASLATKENSLTKLAKPELHVKKKLQEYSERINQPIYPSASSGKINIVEGNVYFTRPKKARYDLSKSSTLNHNESLVAPFKPSDVQSILVPKSEFLINLGTILKHKAAYEQKHGLNDLPITIYDIETGERIHCYECQLFTNRNKEKILSNLEAFRCLNHEQESSLPALKGLPYPLFFDLVENLSTESLDVYFKHNNEIVKLATADCEKPDWRKFCNLISSESKLNFRVFSTHFNIYIPFLENFIQCFTVKGSRIKLCEKNDNYGEKLYYIILRTITSDAKLKQQISELIIPPEFINILFNVHPDAVYKYVLEDNFASPLNDFYKYIDDHLNIHLIDYYIKEKDDTEHLKMLCELILISGADVKSSKHKEKLDCLLSRISLDHVSSKLPTTLKEALMAERIRNDLIQDWIGRGADISFLNDYPSNKYGQLSQPISEEDAEKAASLIVPIALQEWSEYKQTAEYLEWPKRLEYANNNLPKLPDHLSEVDEYLAETESQGTAENKTLGDTVINEQQWKRPFLKPLALNNMTNMQQTARSILNHYYRTLGPNRLTDIYSLRESPRMTTHGSGHALRVFTNIRLLMQLLVAFDLETISPQQKQLLQYAALYHDAAAEDVSKDREEIDSAHYFRRDMTHNCPPHYSADIEAIAEAMEHKEDDIHNRENDELPGQQRLYRRLLRFADRLDIGRCFSIPQDFPNFARKTTGREVDASLLDIDAEWLNDENFKKALLASIHGLVDLAAVSGGATNDQREGKIYLHNYQLNTNASETLAQFFEKTPNPLAAMEHLLDDNVRRYIAKQAGIRTCGDTEHLNCDQTREGGVNFGYTRYIHNSYHDLAQIPLPKMGLCEKLMIEHAPELMSPELKSTIDGEVRRLSGGLKRNIGSPSQETLQAPEAQTFLKSIHGLDVVAEDRLREVIPSETGDGKPSYRYESIFTAKPAKLILPVVNDVQRPEAFEMLKKENEADIITSSEHHPSSWNVPCTIL